MRQSLIQLLSDVADFYRVTPSAKAFKQAVKAPDVAWVLARPRQRRIKPKVSAIDSLSFAISFGIHQQCAKRVSRRLHPTPWLVIK
ncbi:hypothetical protein [Mesorhizobium sp. M7A.F.Ca.US.001.02.1.1]|uniref:hypothetical protein n=1 Tax=Mesorhizobium sp. M7A.F.Ca.US.001.02.1.1 TaxID=2496703 RepID=UPI0019D429C7|nr:hypothetical protein [Mesorhizobium sp. M7A.F.Ca.US.001.02.1.1]